MSEQDHYYHDRLSMALDDLLRCKRYCEMMLKLSIGEAFTEERTVYEALFVSFIVSYGRVFTGSHAVKNHQEVNGKYGNLRTKMTNALDGKLNKLHERIMNKRHTAIAHSAGSSRNYQHYTGCSIPIGRTPYVPYDHEEVGWALELTGMLISNICEEQTREGQILVKST